MTNPTSTLTLPIVIGKRYVRRDGVTVTARAPQSGYRHDSTYVGAPGETVTCCAPPHVWTRTGRSGDSATRGAFDLVADAPAFTLPLQIGRWYTQRNGDKVRALAHLPHVGDDGATRMHDNTLRKTASGAWTHSLEPSPFDLMRDCNAPTDEPAQAEPTRPTAHPLADVLRAIADGRGVQAHVNDEWRDVAAREALHMAAVGSTMRVKPATIRICGVEVEAPLTELPPDGEVWAASPWSAGYVMLGTPKACNDYARGNMVRALERRMLYATREAAAVHGKAMAEMLGTITGAPA